MVVDEPTPELAGERWQASPPPPSGSLPFTSQILFLWNNLLPISHNILPSAESLRCGKQWGASAAVKLLLPVLGNAADSCWDPVLRSQWNLTVS
ncbi:uncharacterized protein N7506_007164 [Penicillium brevicompactum]|uniref:uncharacterized protein n=1 Tax=Penicillium brevicompactum TaxID=5074 RepID=UPI0025405BCC|nr:uncharacterized protein N7506_007164 [Penicillium brevicompactum]KAJ5333381.1 hypothetical protein N7506_007164 [Penicillium brevicompactum]